MKNIFKNKKTPLISDIIKNLSPQNVQILKILAIKLLDTFFNIKPKWCHILKCASPVVFPFKWIR